MPRSQNAVGNKEKELKTSARDETDLGHSGKQASSSNSGNSLSSSPRLTLRIHKTQPNFVTAVSTSSCSVNYSVFNMDNENEVPESKPTEPSKSPDVSDNALTVDETKKDCEQASLSSPPVQGPSVPDHNYSNSPPQDGEEKDDIVPSESDPASPRPKKRQKANNGSDVTASDDSKKLVLSNSGSGKRPHPPKPGSAKRSREKSVSSSDSDDDKMVIDETAQERSSPILTNSSQGASVDGAKPDSPGSGENSAPKVPPLRIVISSSSATAAANVVQPVVSASTSSLVASSDTAQKVPSTTVPTVPKSVSYVVASGSVADENNEESGSDCENQEQNSNSSTTGSNAGRVTRSSQRALQQQESSRERRARERDEKDEVEGQDTSPTACKDGKDSEQSKDGMTMRRRKVRTKKQQLTGQEKPSKQTNEQDDDNESTSSSTSSGAGANQVNPAASQAVTEAKAKKDFQMPSYNSYQMYLSIRKQIDKRRKQMFPVQPKPPQGFKNYLLNKGGYLLKGRTDLTASSNGSSKSGSSLPNLSTPPSSLKPGHALHTMYNEQEKARQRLRIQHVIEREKLRLSAEQEILRVHGRAALAMANQSVPFSVCTILKDDEIYNTIEPEPEGESISSAPAKNNEYQKSTYNMNSTSGRDPSTLTGAASGTSARSRYNGRLFLSWLQDVDDKWEKIKEETILRQRRESESLSAIQKLDWEWKMKELGLCDIKATPVIELCYIPSVEVPSDFELLPS
ncbi:Ankyrin repeat domain-containing protein 12 [Halotydeus destructor]|nr:Ankyrin repeat domain-containing protein 12 [Halotydeus destructor]